MDETEIVKTMSTLEQECKEHDRRFLGVHPAYSII